MPHRKSLAPTLWLISLLALLAAVIVAPIRPAGFVTASSRPDCLRRNLALCPALSMTRLGAAALPVAVLQVNVPYSESEEQELTEDEEQNRADALDEPRVSFLIPRSFRKIPARQSVPPRPILSLYPLRC